jgi:hypothetical protein
MRTGSTLLGVAALFVTLAAQASGQSSSQLVLGQIVDQQTAAPIQGVFVQLVDSAAQVRAGVLSDDAGRFILSAPAPGRYTLRAERIGYAISLSDTLVVTAGRTLTYRFAVPVQAISLEGLEVRGEKRCLMSQESGAATSVLWNEARKALDVVAWMEKQRGVPYQAAIWDRTRDLGTLHLQEGERRIASGFGRQAFASATAEDLATNGFVRQNSDGTVTYYGLDAQTLLSDTFLAGHCFRAVEPHKGEEGLIGLGFEPLKRGGPPDIRGTLWLDRKTSELRYLEFEYTRHLFAVGVAQSHFGGRIEFLRMPNGAWIVRRWWLRMPLWGDPPGSRPVGALNRTLMTMRPDPLMEARANGLRIHEQGAEIQFMPRPASSTSEGTVVLDGTVYDSVYGRPLVGATVFLADASGKAVTTDFLGRFHMSGLPAGHHMVDFFHPFTDSLQILAIARPVTLTAARHTSVALAVPSSDGCHTGTDSGAIVGFVENAANGMPMAGVEVKSAWRTPDRAATGPWIEGADTTDAYGRYLFCGVPLNDPLSLTPVHGATTTLHLDTAGLIHQDLLADAPGS